MLARFPLLIREIERPNSHFNGLGVIRPDEKESIRKHRPTVLSCQWGSIS